MSKSNSTLYFVSLILAIILHSVEVKAQEVSKCRIQHYRAEDGLKQDYIFSVNFDKTDHLWISTHGDLVLFDGQNFNTKFKDDIKPRIISTFTDRYRQVYFVNTNYDLYRVNNKTQKIELLNPKNELWLGDKFYSEVKNEQTFIKISGILNNLQELNASNLFRYQADTLEIPYKEFDLRKPYWHNFFLLEENLITIQTDSIDKSDSTVNFVLYNKNRISTQIGFSGPLKNRSQNYIADNGFFFSSGAYSFVLIDNAIYRLELDETNNSIRSIIYIKDVPINRIENNINSGDYNKNLDLFAFGTAGNGIYLISPAGFNAIFPCQEEKDRDKCAISSHVILPNGDILTGANLLFNTKTSKSRTFLSNLSPHTEILLEDNILWSWHQKTLLRENLATRKKDSLHLDISTTGTDCMIRLNDSILIINNTGKIIKINSDNLMAVELPYCLERPNRIKGMYVKSQDTLILLTRNGLFDYNLNSFTCNLRKGTEKIYFRSARKTEKGNIFISTYGHGYFLYKNDSLYKMPIDFDENLQFPHNFLSDNNGYLWIPTNNGLYKVKEDTLVAYIKNKFVEPNFVRYDMSYGFNSNEFNGGPLGTAIVTKDSMFSLANMKGLVQFYPNHFKEVTYQSPLFIDPPVIDEIKCDTNKNSIYIFPAGYRKADFTVRNAYYELKENLKISYKIENYHDDWILVNTNEKITLPNLSAGLYELIVKKRDHSEITTTKKIIFRVLPHFHETKLFYLIVALLLLLLYYLIAIIYNKNLTRRNAALQIRIRETHKELIKNNIQLSASTSKNDLLISILVHDLKSPLRYLSKVSGTLQSQWDEITNEDRLDAIDGMHISIERINEFIHRILHKIQVENEARIEEEFTLKDLVFETLSFHEMSKGPNNNLEIINDIPDNIVLNEDSKLIQIIINNLLENSLKYTERGFIRFSANTKDSLLSIVCEDTGVGMSSDILDRITSQKQYLNKDEEGYNLGYIFINKIIQLIDAQLSIQSRIGKGTTVQITLKPVKEIRI